MTPETKIALGTMAHKKRVTALAQANYQCQQCKRSAGFTIQRDGTLERVDLARRAWGMVLCNRCAADHRAKIYLDQRRRKR